MKKVGALKKINSDISFNWFLLKKFNMSLTPNVESRTISVINSSVYTNEECHLDFLWN